MSARSLIVDDDPDILAGLKRWLEWMGDHTITAKDGVETLAAIQQEAPTLRNGSRTGGTTLLR